MEPIFTGLWDSLTKNIDPLMVLFVIASGYFQNKYLEVWKINSALKTLAVSFVVCTIYVILVGEFRSREALARYFFSFFMATSMYEIILQPLTNWIEKLKSKTQP